MTAYERRSVPQPYSLRALEPTRQGVTGPFLARTATLPNSRAQQVADVATAPPGTFLSLRTL
jgi:hypothetical protein